MVLPTVTEGIVGKQFQSYDVHVCDFSSTVSGRPPFLRTTRGGGKVKNNNMQINGKKGEIFFFTWASNLFLVDLPLTPCMCLHSTMS